MEASDPTLYDYQITKEDFAHRPAMVIPVIRPVQHPYSNKNAGFVYLSISQQMFIHEMANYTLDDKSTLFLKIGDVYYQLKEDSMIPLEASLEFQDFSEHYQIQNDTEVFYLENNGSKSVAISRPLSFHSCSVIQTITPGSFLQQLHRYVFLGILIFVVVLIIGLFLTGMLSRLFTQPVIRLRKRISLIAGGDFTQDDTILWDNELGDMGRDINQLSLDIKTLIDNRLTAENQKRNYEYQLLQSQINPHFLYNTLNSIKWMATIQKADGIAEMTLALSRLFKNISKGANILVSIRQEFDLLEDYFTIQKYRYGGAISMEYEITDEELLLNEIPRFSLQPIVENAIFHGIEPKGRAGIIKIKLYSVPKDMVCIDVTDNGVGMSREKIIRLLTEDVPDHSSFFRNVGISNVHRYLQYTYGEPYGLHIESEVGQYTTVSTLLPHKILNEEEKQL
ncbi:MAG: sensor histidine kinase [Eubacteriales bacterium]|nr:sensor histidine kinase [Eubacteriales bacterium]